MTQWMAGRLWPYNLSGENGKHSYARGEQARTDGARADARGAYNALGHAQRFD
jgi:hypothetical protein